MDKSKILESTLLEKYVLGTASDLEIEVVEQAIDLFPEVKEELNRVELALEKAALDNKISAPEGTKESILQSIKNVQNAESVEATSIPIASSRLSNYLAYTAAFLLGCALTGFIGWNNLNGKNRMVESLEARVAILENDCDKNSTFFAFVNDPRTLPVYMASTGDKSTYSAISYWNNEQEKALLKIVNLPVLADDKTYQIWADVDGEMLNLGLIDFTTSSREFVDLKYLANAESLNITIEPAGGSDHPTVVNLVVSGVI